ncbi:MAG: hypothetical protein O7G85_07775 [Planctomycetota bacterium]|nr:hypothetical protein [Planctomycetota bacterium]
MHEKQINPFVSRAGLKLEHALNEFDFDVTDLVCADFGCNVGGFTDCLLQRGAKQVYALDTGYGTLAWKLRSDDRVVVMERTNALHAKFPAPTKKTVEEDSLHQSESMATPSPLDPLPEGEGKTGVDLVTIDLAWTPQRYAIPAALSWLAPTPRGRIITLIKPHYELDEAQKKTMLHQGALDPEDALMVMQRVLESMPALGMEVLNHVISPIKGKKSSSKKKSAGNVEYLALLRPIVRAQYQS